MNGLIFDKEIYIMKNLLRYIGYCCFTLICIWAIGRLTNALQWYISPTITDYPNIMLGERFFATNLLKPKKFDLICYYSETPEFGKQVWTHRVCGLAGDVIEIKSGDLFVNGQNADKNLSLAHNYILPRLEFEKIIKTEKIVDSLISKGHEVKFVKSLGAIEAILVYESGILEGAADFIRGKDDFAEGY